MQAAKTREKVVAQFNRLALLLSTAVILVGGLIIFSSMLAAVRERRREIGIFRAVGFRGVNILEIILFETVMLALVGGVLGYLIGLAATVLAAPALGLSGPVEINLTVGYFTLLGTMVVTLVSSLYPALRAAGLSPMIALNDF